jgi:hypothetical protein
MRDFAATSLLIPAPLNDFSMYFRTLSGTANHYSAWARFLPCSLEPDAFMRSHHNGVFRNRPVQEANSYAEAYNAIGYELIAPAVRMDCLQKLLELISQRNNKVSLVVASGSEPELQDAIRYFRNYDNVVTIDDKLTFWRDAGRNITWSWQSDKIQLRRKYLLGFENGASYRQLTDVQRLLGELCKQIR